MSDMGWPAPPPYTNAGSPSKVGKKELAKLASEQANVLAFADRNREIVELPEGLETGYTKRRKRGDRSDSDCINEICELVSQGITATASVRFVGVRWATWQAWLKKNRELDDLAIPVSKRKHISLLGIAVPVSVDWCW
jgi:hypothetical protein